MECCLNGEVLYSIVIKVDKCNTLRPVDHWVLKHSKFYEWEV
jgi:hypothetical protein